MATKKPLRFLIVEDNEMTRGVLRTIINSEKRYTVAGEATNGNGGIEMAEKLRPDIVCLDVNMPNVDGLDVLRHIRQVLPRTTVMMITASNDLETVQTALGLGAAGFIVKPFNAGTVLDSIEYIVERFHSADGD